MKTIERPRIENDLTRRSFLIGAGLIALAPACSGDGAGNEGTSPETRTIEHALGTTEIPVSPGRIVVADRRETLPNLLALGVEPIAAGTGGFTGRPFPNVPRSFDGEVEDVEALEIAESVNIEQVATLEPDLILGVVYEIEPVYEELSQIAPTVAIPTNLEDFLRFNVRFAGRVFGLEGRADELIAEFDRRTEEAFEDKSALGTVSIASIFDGEVRFYSEESTFGSLVTNLGAEVAPDQADLDRLSEEEVQYGILFGGSEELIPELSGESLILLQNSTSAEEVEYVDEIEARPIWQSLTSVQDGSVLTLDIQTVGDNGGLPGARIALDSLIDFFSDER